MSADEIPGGIAVIGMAGRFPGAPNLEAYWQNLRNGVESITYFSEHELEVPASISSNPQYVRARGIIEGVDLFDADFFGINPREAEYTDPQQRLILETAWQAIEDAGYDTERFTGSMGVFAGCSANTYLLCNLASHPGFLTEYLSFQQVGAHPSMFGNDKDFIATRIAYKLNLHGPSIAVQSACSTSLVAICQACQNLLTYQCDIALGGGVSITFPQKRGYVAEEGSLASADGRCRPFDVSCGGTVFGDGVGMVVLKRLDEAIRDGDNVRAIIRGFGVNNDGSTKVSYMAPSVDGQAEAVATAQALAGIDVSTIRYIEAHGTGTSLGDPIEVAALTKAFRGGTSEKQFCSLGAVKGNIGHLESASGVAGLIKTILILEHGEIPATLHFSAPNPRIDFANSPFYVSSTLQPWPATDVPRRAGVSSFGVGGTNAHIVLEQGPVPAAVPVDSQPQLFVLSAKTPTALDAATQRLAEHLKLHPEQAMADVASTLQIGRRAFRYRRAWVGTSASETAELLAQPKSPRIFTAQAPAGKGSVAFLFPGQGAQRVDMGRGMYDTNPVFRDNVDRCCELLAPDLGLDLRSVLYPPATADKNAAADQLMQTSLTQPALFVVEYAMAQAWLSIGLKPQIMTGHSLGEYVAATLAGVFTLEDALHLLAMRGRLMQSLPSGTMLAVVLPEAEVVPLLTEGLSLAAVNGPKLCVVSGPEDIVAALAKTLSEKKIATRNQPQIPIVSAMLGRLGTDEEWMSPGYWCAQLRHTVRFADAVGVLLAQPSLVLLEVGPGQTLTTLARQNPAKQPAQAAIYSSPRGANDSEAVEFLSAAGQLWIAGVEIDWLALHGGSPRRRVPLPSYPFERKRHWIETYRPMEGQAPAQTHSESASLEANGIAANGAAPSLSEIEAIVDEQLRIMARQIEALRAAPASVDSDRRAQP